jgi:hypothetical protein
MEQTLIKPSHVIQLVVNLKQKQIIRLFKYLIVIRKALLGGFGCPVERFGFSEPYTSQYDLSQAVNKTALY